MYNNKSIVKYRYKSNGEETLFKSKNTIVVDKWEQPQFEDHTPVSVMNSRSYNKWDGLGHVNMQCTIQQHLVTPGTDLSIGISVENTSKKRLNGIKVSFIRKLSILKPCQINFKDNQNSIKSFNETMQEYHFKEKCYCFDPKENRCTSLSITIPVKIINYRKHGPYAILHFV
jgi:hypothetical protein